MVVLRNFIENNYFPLVFFLILTLFFNASILSELSKFFDIERKNPEFTILQDPAWDGELFTSSLDYAKEKIFEYKKFYITDDRPVGYLYVIQGLIIMFLFKTTSITAHNLLFIISFFLSGFFMYLLAFKLTKNRLGSLLAGFFYCTTNYLFGRFIIGHGVLFQLQWLPLFFLFLEELMSKPKFKNSLFLGLSLSLIILSSPYYTVYLTIIAPIYCFSRNVKLFKNKRLVFLILIAIAVSLLFSSFYIFGRLNSQYTVRTIEENLNPGWRLDSFWELTSPKSGKFFIGQIPLLLACCGIYYALIKKDKKMVPFVLVLFASLMLSIGPISNFAPYTILYKVWPFINKFRTPYRIFPFALMSIALLINLFFKELTKNMNYKQKLLLFLSIIATIIVFNHFPSPYTLSLKALTP